MSPKVSVIVPIYKVEKYIEKCARSLFEQTLDSMEFIFIDDCSPDKSIEILEKLISYYPQRRDQIKLIRHSINQGVGKSRKDGLEASTGEYVIHCDPDDWVEIEMYEKLYKEAINNNADIVICDYYEIFLKRKRVITIDNKIDILPLIFKGKIHSSLCNKLIKKNLYNNLNIKFKKGLNFWEDMAIIPRLIYKCKKVYIVNSPLYFYNRINTTSYTNHNWNSAYSYNIIEALKINFLFFEKKNINIDDFMTRGIALILEKENYKLDTYLKKDLINLQAYFSPKYYSIFSFKRKLFTWLYFHKFPYISTFYSLTKRLKLVTL